MPRLQENVSLLPYNTFGIEASTRWWMEVTSEAEAVEFVVDNLHARRPVLPLGGGSNLLFTRDFEGLVLKMGIMGREIVSEDAHEVIVKAGAGENWHELVRWTIGHGWGGIENLSLIPGTLGAAPIQNIGAYGIELKDVFHSLEAIHLETGQIHHFGAADCRFGYRDSVFKRELKGKYLISQVSLRLSKQPVLHTDYGDIRQELERLGGVPDVKKVSEAVCTIRRSKLPDPREVGNAGSFFKNPVISQAHFDELKGQYPDMPAFVQADGVKVPAAWLIQTCGWKGRRMGNYGVHDRQALVLVNYGGAQGADIYELSSQILASVQQQFGIALEREVNII
ncbi:MAG: UDP-N-acetylmuramate dehydrogenase [Bacteroidetes bacterium]|nr:MAG: UDP-N-acetylmuramate dehydrogenase [Bacteroidota bacterium]